MASSQLPAQADNTVISPRLAKNTPQKEAAKMRKERSQYSCPNTEGVRAWLQLDQEDLENEQESRLPAAGKLSPTLFPNKPDSWCLAQWLPVSLLHCMPGVSVRNDRIATKFPHAFYSYTIEIPELEYSTPVEHLPLTLEAFPVG